MLLAPLRFLGRFKVGASVFDIPFCALFVISLNETNNRPYMRRKASGMGPNNRFKLGS